VNGELFLRASFLFFPHQAMVARRRTLLHSREERMALLSDWHIVVNQVRQRRRHKISRTPRRMRTAKRGRIARRRHGGISKATAMDKRWMNK
jgi:hypothetical protein